MVFCERGRPEISGEGGSRGGFGFAVRGDKIMVLRVPLRFMEPEGHSPGGKLGSSLCLELQSMISVAGMNILWDRSSCQSAGLCGRCEELCPTGVLDLGSFPGGGLEGAVCTRCRLCLYVCPTGALSLLPLALSRFPRTESISESFV